MKMENSDRTVLSKLCWVCLSEKPNMTSILDSPRVCEVLNKTKLSIYDILSYVTSTEILYIGGPHRLCELCQNQACAAYKFKQKCDNSTKVCIKNGLRSCKREHFEVIADKSDEQHLSDNEQVLHLQNECALENNDLKTTFMSQKLVNVATEKFYIKSENVSNSNSLSISCSNGTSLQELLNSEDNDRLYKTNNHKPVLKTHRNRKRLPELILCTICGKQKLRRNLKQHMITHENLRVHACTYCPRKFNDKTNLKVHLRIHTKEYPYLCKCCGKTFAQATTYKIHMRVHEDIRPYKCHLCSHTTRTNSHLQKHIKRHTGNKSYPCDQCDYSAYTNYELKSHLAKHSSDKNHVCKVCGKAFVRKKTLKVHEQSHSGNKPHICSLCDRGFTQAHSLRSHLKNVHKAD